MGVWWEVGRYATQSSCRCVAAAAASGDLCITNKVAVCSPNHQPHLSSSLAAGCVRAGWRGDEKPGPHSRIQSFRITSQLAGTLTLILESSHFLQLPLQHFPAIASLTQHSNHAFIASYSPTNPQDFISFLTSIPLYAHSSDWFTAVTGLANRSLLVPRAAASALTVDNVEHSVQEQVILNAVSSEGSRS